LIRRLPWTLRAILVALAVLSAFAVWQAAASVIFIKIMSTVMPASHFESYYRYSSPDTYLQWLAYLNDDEWPSSINKWLAISGIAPLLPVGAYLARWLLDRRSGSHYSATGPRPLYGETHRATRGEMEQRGISFKPKLPGQP
jgi:hypothetical protein